MVMLYRLIFNRANPQKKRQILSSRGVVIGSFKRNGKQKYVYLLDNFFVEVVYKNDDINDEIEEANSFSDYRKLEKYMEESIRENH